MSRSKSGVAKLVQDEEPRAVYTHCYGHALNLACSDLTKRCKLMKMPMILFIRLQKASTAGFYLSISQSINFTYLTGNKNPLSH